MGDAVELGVEDEGFGDGWGDFNPQGASFIVGRRYEEQDGDGDLEDFDDVEEDEGDLDGRPVAPGAPATSARGTRLVAERGEGDEGEDWEDEWEDSPMDGEAREFPMDEDEDEDDWQGEWEAQDFRAQSRSGTRRTEEDDEEDDKGRGEEAWGQEGGPSDEFDQAMRWDEVDDTTMAEDIWGDDDLADDPLGNYTDKGISDDELSLLYDDFELSEAEVSRKEREDLRKAAKVRAQAQQGGQSFVEELMATNPSGRGGLRKDGRKLSSLEDREYVVEAEGIAIRTLPDERSPRTGEVMRQGEKFTAIEAVDGVGGDLRLYLRLPEGRGWVFDDEKIYPGLPSVKLLSIGGRSMEEEKPELPPLPLVAVIGRPNVGKSSMVNKICDLGDINGHITFDEPGVTRDLLYNTAEHSNSEAKTFLFEVIDTGGLVFQDDLETITFKKQMQMQIDIALRQSVAAIMVVDSQVGVTEDDMKIAKYLKNTYICKGLKVVLAVAKCDRLESMDMRCAEFWALDLGEPIPMTSLHGRGIWEVCDALIQDGCDGLFPQKIRGLDDEEQYRSRRETSTGVAIIGKPNVGKSSLLNALVGEERSIVSDIPGTTTDAIDAYLETEEGKTFRFVDTAGVRRKMRVGPGSEWLSVNRALKAIRRCDCTLLCLDASEVMHGRLALGNAFWCPDQQHRYLARAIEERGKACVIVLTKWDAVAVKDEKTQRKFVEAVRNNLAGVGQWAEIVTCSAHTGQRLKKILEAVDKTLVAHKKRVKTPVLNEVVRDALLWKLPPTSGSRQGRIYYATQVSSEPPAISLFCNDPKLFSNNYKVYMENKLRQDLAWFGTPMLIEYRKRTEKKARKSAEEWLTPRLQPEEAWR